jgi:hypothetical protein
LAPRGIENLGNETSVVDVPPIVAASSVLLGHPCAEKLIAVPRPGVRRARWRIAGKARADIAG